MDNAKVGKLIQCLRKEKNLTQRELGELLHISDRTVSKWERGMGCPDVSLLAALSHAFGVNIEKILLGDLEKNNTDGGNMKRLKFYTCPVCGSITSGTGSADVFCCGRKLEAMIAKKSDETHFLRVEPMEDEYYISFEHEMSKEHYISFVAYVSYDRMLLVRLYPEQGSELRIPQMHGGKLYFGCNKHGLWCNG